MSNPCLILSWGSAGDWPAHGTGETQRAGDKPVRIPDSARPLMLQPDRETAEAEALRLAKSNPSQRFAVFEATVEARTFELPSHVTVGGQLFQTRKHAALVEICDDAIPF